MDILVKIRILSIQVYFRNLYVIGYMVKKKSLVENTFKILYNSIIEHLPWVFMCLGDADTAHCQRIAAILQHNKCMWALKKRTVNNIVIQ